jgi:hypothetical protein
MSSRHLAQAMCNKLACTQLAALYGRFKDLPREVEQLVVRNAISIVAEE